MNLLIVSKNKKKKNRRKEIDRDLDRSTLLADHPTTRWAYEKKRTRRDLHDFLTKIASHRSKQVSSHKKTQRPRKRRFPGLLPF